MKINANQGITGRKEFITVGGNTWDKNNLMTLGTNGSKAGMTFYSSGMDIGQINFDGYFNFKDANDDTFKYLKGNGFIKDGYNDGFILLAGGGHVPISEFTIPSDLTNYHNIDKSGGIHNGSDIRFNKSWFDYNWANVGAAGSVINFSGLNEAYSTELFSDYQTGTVIGMRTRNGDAGVWNSPKILWHDHNFNPTDKISYTGADKPINLNGQNLSNITRLSTNGAIKHNGLGLSLVNASGSGEYNSILVKTGFTTGNMGTFTVKLYNYAHEYFEFNVNNYKYNNSNYATNITWKAGNSKRIERIEFLKDSYDNLYINIVSYLAYPRIAITDLMVYGWEDEPFNNANWSIELGGSISALISEGQAIPKDFLRDEGLDTSFWKIYDDGSLKGLLTDKPFSFVTNGGDTAQKILTGGLLTSDYYGDTVNVPANGIYSKGFVKSLSGIKSDYYASDIMTGSQIMAISTDTIYLGNVALPNIRIETNNDIKHYKAGVVGTIWTTHNFNPSIFVTTSQLSNYVTLDTPQGINSEKTFNTYFSSYTSDGLFDSNADSNLKTNTPSGRKVIFGYRDYGGGQYYPRIGFTSNTNWSLGTIGDYFTIGTNNDSTETFKITSTEAYINGHRIWNESNFTSVDITNWNQAYNWGNHSAAGYATQSLVEESIAELTLEITNPSYHIQSKNKFVTIIITDDFSNEKIIWEEFFPEQSINVINTGERTIDLDLQGTTFDRIGERETIEYYINKNRKLIKKGNYRETVILL